jgi:hypothetical protein
MRKKEGEVPVLPQVQDVLTPQEDFEIKYGVLVESQRKATDVHILKGEQNVYFIFR